MLISQISIVQQAYKVFYWIQVKINNCVAVGEKRKYYYKSDAGLKTIHFHGLKATCFDVAASGQVADQLIGLASLSMNLRVEVRCCLRACI